MTNSHLERVSFWFDSLDSIPVPEVPNELPTKVDVAIVGGGFTGLWTAYYLKWLQPDLDIVVLEAMTVGFGASGRNGGWCMGTAAGVEGLLADPTTRDSGVRVLREMMATVDEVLRVCQAENIDCHYAKGGTLAVAHAPFTVKRLRAEVDNYAEHGFADYCHWLPAEESRQRINCTRNHGAILYASLCRYPSRKTRTWSWRSCSQTRRSRFRIDPGSRHSGLDGNHNTRCYQIRFRHPGYRRLHRLSCQP